MNIFTKSNLIKINTNLSLVALTLAFTALKTSAQTAVQSLREDTTVSPINATFRTQFGAATAISDGILAVSSVRLNLRNEIMVQGSVSLFDMTTRTPLHSFNTNDDDLLDSFGYSLDFDNGIVVVGVPGDIVDDSINTGSVQLFDSITGLPIRTLFPTSSEPVFLFGKSVSIHNGLIAVGSSAINDIPGDPNVGGSVYIFDANTGSQIAKIDPEVPISDEEFGHSVALRNNTLAVGSVTNFSTTNRSGSAYLFNAITGEQLFHLYPDDPTQSDRFGYAVHMDEEFLAVETKGNAPFYGFISIFNPTTGLLINQIIPAEGSIGNSPFDTYSSLHNGLLAFTFNAINDDLGYYISVFDLNSNQEILKLSPTQEEFSFGTSVAVGEDVIAVGDTRYLIEDDYQRVAYLYVIPTLPDRTITAPDAAPNDTLGRSVAVSNNTIVTGSRNDDDNGSNSGSAYLFNANTGSEISKLLPNDGAQGDHFGVAVAIHEENIVVGAPRDADNGTRSGSAYIFNTDTHTQTMKILPDDGQPNDQFGLAVSIDSNTIAVGSQLDDNNGIDSGSAYLFDLLTGTQTHKLLPLDGTANDNFGNSLDINNGLVAVGAMNATHNGIESGAAYIFDSSTGAQLHKLIPPDGHIGDNFGHSIAIDNGIVAVGAIGDDDNGEDSGSVHLFNALTGQHIVKINQRFGTENDLFGNSVDLDSGILAVGAYQSGRTGIAYLHDAITGEFIDKLIPTNSSLSDGFGYSVAIDTPTVVVGSWRSGIAAQDAGAAFIYNTAKSIPCLPDLNADNELDFFDISAFLALYAASDPAADFNDDAVIDFFDISSFLTAFTAGCP